MSVEASTIDAAREEHERQPERHVFGEHEVMVLPLEKLIVLPQIRADLNPMLPRLVDDIRANGLINQVDVALLDEQGFDAYLQFVNEVWGYDLQASAYSGFKDEDSGHYSVVIAGQTRYLAMKQIAEEDGVAADAKVKVYRDLDPQGIINRQFAENLHSEPSLERQAMAIVESYRFGLRHGHWQNKTEFRQYQEGKVSRTMLDNALAFVDLPAEVRDFTFAGHFSYSTAVELGRAVPTLERFVATTVGGSETQQAEIVRLRLLEKVTHIQKARLGNKNFGVTKQRAHIKNWLVELSRQIDARENDAQTVLELELFSIDEEVDRALATARRGWREAVTLLAREPLNVAADALRFHRRAGISEEEWREILNGVDQHRRLIGEQAVASEYPDLYNAA